MDNMENNAIYTQQPLHSSFVINRYLDYIINANTKSTNHMAVTPCIQARRHGQDELLKFRLANTIGKKCDLRDFECITVVYDS